LGEKTTRIDTAKATKTKCITPHRYHCTTVHIRLNDYTEGRIFDIIFREFHKRKEKENVENHDSG
jgi:hypothetical protein